jgi:dTDP-glucose 4,6-dehydratase
MGRAILEVLGKPASLVTHVADRPGHVRRHAVATAKIERLLGWQPRIAFREGLAATIAWYRENRPWWERVKSGEFRDYYRRMYGERGPAATGPQAVASPASAARGEPGGRA